MNFEEQQLHKEKAKEYEKLDASKRPERAEKIIDFLDKINAFEFFQNLDLNKDKVDFQSFKSFLLRLNGIARNIPIKERNFDGKNVEISGGLLGETILPPKAENKEELLNLAFNFSEDLDTQDNSYMIPAVINSLHMFNDGNGRTSRILHLLLNSKDKETFNLSLRKALVEDGRFYSYDINPSLVESEIRERVLENHNWNFFTNDKGYRRGGSQYVKGRMSPSEKGIDLSDENFIANLRKFDKLYSADMEYSLTSIVESLSEKKYDELLVDEKFLSPIKMKVLSEDEWKMIFSKYYKLKKEHVETLIWIFRDPDTYKNPMNENETIKDLFIRKIKDEYEFNNKK